MWHLPESRFVAFAAHLLLSVTVFSCLAAFVYFILLPDFLFFSEGGITILSLIGGIDVVLGPLITLIIYKKTKPSIKFDLTVIAMLQIAALTYGLHALWSVRPLAVFYVKDSYHVVYESTFKGSTFTDITQIPELNQLKTPILSIEVPNNITSTDALLFQYMYQQGKSYFSQSELYKSYQEKIPDLKNEGVSLQEALKKNFIPSDSRFLKYDSDQFRVYRFRGSLHSGYLLIDTKTGKFADITF